MKTRWLLRMLIDNLRARRGAPALAASGDPVLLLPGFGGTPRMLRPLERFLREELGRPTLALGLGLGLADVRHSALRVLRRLERRGVSRCDVVGYSRGGCVAAYLVKCADPAGRIRRVVTIGAPHRGAPIVARLPRGLVRRSGAARQMGPGSPFLEELARRPLPPGALLVSIAGQTDALVPPRAARVDGAGCRNLVAPGVDHLHLLTSRQVFRWVEQALRPTLLSRSPSAAPDPGARTQRGDAGLAARAPVAR